MLDSGHQGRASRERSVAGWTTSSSGRLSSMQSKMSMSCWPCGQDTKVTDLCEMVPVPESHNDVSRWVAVLHIERPLHTALGEYSTQKKTSPNCINQ